MFWEKLGDNIGGILSDDLHYVMSELYRKEQV